MDITPQDNAIRLFQKYYFLLFDSDTDKGQEILINILAKKCAIAAAKEVITAMHDKCKDADLVFWAATIGEIKTL